MERDKKRVEIKKERHKNDLESCKENCETWNNERRQRKIKRDL